MRSLPYWPSRAVAIVLTITFVLAVMVIGFYAGHSAEAARKPGNGHGNGDITPPETTITAGPAEGSTATQASASFSF